MESPRAQEVKFTAPEQAWVEKERDKRVARRKPQLYLPQRRTQVKSGSSRD
ncbi:Hypothetical predicted protein, partial [Pelobates cultripes]